VSELGYFPGGNPAEAEMRTAGGNRKDIIAASGNREDIAPPAAIVKTSSPPAAILKTLSAMGSLTKRAPEWTISRMKTNAFKDNFFIKFTDLGLQCE